MTSQATPSVSQSEQPELVPSSPIALSVTASRAQCGAIRRHQADAEKRGAEAAQRAPRRRTPDQDNLIFRAALHDARRLRRQLTPAEVNECMLLLLIICTATAGALLWIVHAFVVD